MAEDIDTLRIKAEQGDAEAQYRLGMYYEEENNIGLAAEWLIKATEQKHSKAYEELLILQKILSNNFERQVNELPEYLRGLI